MNTVPAKISPHAAIESYFLRPPLLSTESRNEYEAMFKALAAMLKPQDASEWFWTGDYLHYSWQIRRWRKSAANIIELMRKDGLRAILESVVEGEGAERSRLIDGYIESWFKDDESKMSILDVLARHGLNEGHVTAQAMALRLPELDKFERLIGDFERRRSAALRELEDYRIAASWRAPKRLPALIDAEADAVSIAPTTDVAANSS